MQKLCTYWRHPQIEGSRWMEGEREREGEREGRRAAGSGRAIAIVTAIAMQGSDDIGLQLDVAVLNVSVNL